MSAVNTGSRSRDYERYAVTAAIFLLLLGSADDYFSGGTSAAAGDSQVGFGSSGWRFQPPPSAL